MGKKSKTNDKKKSKKEKSQVFENILKKTVTEMIQDLSLVNGEKSAKLLQLTKDLTGSQLVENLKNTESELFKEIPRESLSKDSQGQKYLKMFAMIQSKYEEFVVNTPAILTPVETPNLSSMFQPNEENKELMGLANSLFQDLNLEDKNAESLGMSDMMQMLSQVGESMKEKVDKGELNMQQIEQQATNFVTQLKNAPEFKAALDSNPQLQAMMSMLPEM